MSSFGTILKAVALLDEAPQAIAALDPGEFVEVGAVPFRSHGNHYDLMIGVRRFKTDKATAAAAAVPKASVVHDADMAHSVSPAVSAQAPPAPSLAPGVIPEPPQDFPTGWS